MRLNVCKWAVFFGMGIGTLVPFAGFMADEDEWPFSFKYPKSYYEACVAAFVPHLFWVLQVITTNIAHGIVTLLVTALLWILNVEAWCPSECFDEVDSDGWAPKIETIKASTYTPVTVTRPVVRPKPVVINKPKPVVVAKPQPIADSRRITVPGTVVNNVTNTNVTNNNQTVNNVNNVTNNVTNVVNNTTVINQVAPVGPLSQPT